MKFAKIQYAGTKQDIPVNCFIKKMPQRLQDFYIVKKNPYTIKELNILGAEGYEVCLPVTLKEAEVNQQKNESILSHTLSDLARNEVGIVMAPSEVFFSGQIRQAQGKIIFAFFIMKTVNKIFKLLEKDRKNAEFLIIDGENFLTDLVLDCVFPEVNFLSIYTNRVQKFEDLGTEIYQDSGLNVQVFSNYKNVFLREADVVINCGMDLDNYDYFFKKRAVYLDVNQNKVKLNRLMAKRGDMFFVDGIELKKEEYYLSGEMMESVEYINNTNFRYFLSKAYRPNLQRTLMSYFNQMNSSITDLTCNGKRIAFKPNLSMRAREYKKSIEE